MKLGCQSRIAAMELLESVLERNQSLERAVSKTLHILNPQDRRFARLTAITVLRHLGRLDGLISRLIEKPPAGKAKRVLYLLRIGAAQILLLQTPSHGAVDACVSAARETGLAKLSGLVNAVLRRISREKPTLPPALESLPYWLRKDWEAQYDTETVRAISEALLSEPPIDITIPNDIDHWSSVIGGEVLGGSTTLRCRGKGDITTFPGFSEGAWWVQDAAAALPVGLLGNVHEKHVIDLCAAPGGKTAQLCKAGALPIAVDRSASRLKRLRDNLARLSFDPTIVQADATVWQPDSHVDAVLLDAPCSATGTLRRHPEIAWRRGPSDVTKLVTLQKKLVKSASQMLKPGGRLVVVTCSLQEEEGPGLARFAASLDSLIPDPVQPNELPSCFATAATKEGWLRTHPAMLEEQGYCDGFFAARFRRKI